MRYEVISLDTGGDFASETPWLLRHHPERYTYTYSVTTEGPSFRAWWDVRVLARDINNTDLTSSLPDHETSILTRARLNVDGGSVVRPWDVHLELQDSRDIAGADDEAENVLDVRRLYLYFGNAYTPFGMKVGRFAPMIGSGRLFGSDEDDNVSPGFDGCVLTFADAFHYREPRYFTWRIDAWYARPVAPEAVSFDDNHAGYDVYGAYVEHRRFWPITVSSGVIAREWRHDETGETATGRSLSFDVTGRAFGEWKRGFDFDAEASMQIGKRGGNDLWAWFLYGEMGHTFGTPWKPRAALRLTWGAGDDNATDGRIHTFRADSGAAPLAEMGFTGMLGWSNCVTFQGQLSMSPLPWASLYGAVRAGFLDSEIAPWYNRKGEAVLQDPTGAAGGSIGVEGDVWVELTPEDFWRLRAGYGRFMPGNMPEALGRSDAAEVFFIEFRVLF